MKELSMIDILKVAGGEIIPGDQSEFMLSLNVKLMVAAGRNEPGFDVTVAAHALNKYANAEFWNMDVAYQYVRYASTPLP